MSANTTSNDVNMSTAQIASDYWTLNGTPSNPSLWGPDGLVIHIYPPTSLAKHWSFRVGMPNGCDFTAMAELEPMSWQDIRWRINKSALARHIGIDKSVLLRWKRIPEKHERKVKEFLAGLFR